MSCAAIFASLSSKSSSAEKKRKTKKTKKVAKKAKIPMRKKKQKQFKRKTQVLKKTAAATKPSADTNLQKKPSRCAVPLHEAVPQSVQEVKAECSRVLKLLDERPERQHCSITALKRGDKMKTEGLLQLRHPDGEVVQVTSRKFGSRLDLTFAVLEQAMSQGYVKAQLEKMKTLILGQ